MQMISGAVGLSKALMPMPAAPLLLSASPSTSSGSAPLPRGARNCCR